MKPAANRWARRGYRGARGRNARRQALALEAGQARTEAAERFADVFTVHPTSADAIGCTLDAMGESYDLAGVAELLEAEGKAAGPLETELHALAELLVDPLGGRAIRDARHDAGPDPVALLADALARTGPPAPHLGAARVDQVAPSIREAPCLI